MNRQARKPDAGVLFVRALGKFCVMLRGMEEQIQLDRNGFGFSIGRFDGLAVGFWSQRRLKVQTFSKKIISSLDLKSVTQ